MKFNYIYYKDSKTGKIFVVTIAYTDYQYSFAIQSLGDQHCKQTGRQLAEGRLIEDKSIRFNNNKTWGDIKNHFDSIRQSNRRWYFTMSSITWTFEFPRHIVNAKKLLSKQEKINKFNRHFCPGV